MKSLILAVFTAVFFSFNAWAQTQVPNPTSVINPTEKSEQSGNVRWQTFEIVWRTVKEKHFDPNFGGLNWDEVRNQFAPRVAEVKSDGELYLLLQQMLGQLRQSHFNIIPPEALLPEGTSELLAGSIGIDLRMIDGAAVITSIKPGSGAAISGLRTGFILKQIGEKTVEQIIEPYTKLDEPPVRKELRMTRRLLLELGGKPGSTVSLICLDAKDQPFAAVVVRGKSEAELSPPLGNFPPQPTEFESRRLEGNIAYIKFNVFTTPVMEKVRAAIRNFGDASGMIFDLRGNPGGVGQMASGIAGLLATKQGSLGTMKMRNNQLNFPFFPQDNTYTGPVVVIIDRASASTSEVFSSGMQEIGRAIIVGERSLGAALPSFFQKLPTGAIFQFAIADFKTPKGVLIEGRGVIPNVEVKWNRASLLTGRDAQLEAAIEQIRLNSRPVK